MVRLLRFMKSQGWEMNQLMSNRVVVMKFKARMSGRVMRSMGRKLMSSDRLKRMIRESTMMAMGMVMVRKKEVMKFRVRMPPQVMKSEDRSS